MYFKHGEAIEFFDSHIGEWIPSEFCCIHSFPNVFLIRAKGRLAVAVDWLTRKIQ